MWTRELYEAGIPNLTVYLVRRDGVAKHYAVFPMEGFLLRAPMLDVIDTEPDGEVRAVQYVSRGGNVEQLTYDWQANPKGYVAVREAEVR